jgi:hypothetical protein
MTVASLQSPSTTGVAEQLKFEHRGLEGMTVERASATMDAVSNSELVAELQASALNFSAA